MPTAVWRTIERPSMQEQLLATGLVVVVGISDISFLRKLAVC